MNSVAIVYDDRRRPETTGVYCYRALQTMVASGRVAEVQHLTPDKLASSEKGRFQTYLFVDDGLAYPIPRGLTPSIWWAIDTHLTFARCLDRARQADIVFAAQRDGAERLAMAGVRSVTWLPLACDPEIHGRQRARSEKRYDVSFVGNQVGRERVELLRKLGTQFPNSFIGRQRMETMADTYSASRVVFNRSVANDINMRVFEGMASGSLLLTNNLAHNGMEHLFRDGVHLVTYDNSEGLFEQLRFYLKHENESESEEIAATGYREVIRKHTYIHRIERILSSLGGDADASTLGASRKRFRHGDALDASPAVSLAAHRESGGASDVGMAASADEPTVAPAHIQRSALKIAYIGDFVSPGKSEQYATEAIRAVGHQVDALHDAAIASAGELIATLRRGGYDCFVFHKGCLAASAPRGRLRPTGHQIAHVLHESQVPGFTWYFDRAHAYDYDPSRMEWMRRVAPLCRLAFVTDGALARTDWARWYVLRQGVAHNTVSHLNYPDEERSNVGFIGQVYGSRHEELARVAARYEVGLIQGVLGSALSHAIGKHKIILGPAFPSAPQCWSNRLYVVLGHGGFFLAPEVPGMREEGFLPGTHYAALDDDPLLMIKYWLDRPKERRRISRAGQTFVLNNCTYEHRAREMISAIRRVI